jgi:hypothetical protein
MTGHGAIIGHRIRDRSGRFFGFGRDTYAAWEDAWRRIQENPADDTAGRP